MRRKKRRRRPHTINFLVSTREGPLFRLFLVVDGPYDDNFDDLSTAKPSLRFPGLPGRLGIGTAGTKAAFVIRCIVYYSYIAPHQHMQRHCVEAMSHA